MGSEVVERPGAERWVPDRPTLTSLEAAAHECRGCELYLDATQVVIGAGSKRARVMLLAGSKRARVMLLGEQPGDREDLAGEPFVGPAGGVLDRALAAAGIGPDLVYLTNAVKHFRWKPAPRGKRRIHQRPGRAHVEACRPWLLAELDVVRPEGVVLLGATAGQAIYGAAFRVTEVRGRELAWPAEIAVERPPGWAIATVHPSSILRSQGRAEAFEALVADLNVAAAHLVQ